MDKNHDCADTDPTTLLAILALGADEIVQGKYKDAEDLFLELDNVDSPPQYLAGKLEP